MDATTAWAMILGVLTPLLVSVINRPTWTNTQKRLIALSAAVAVGVGNLLVQGELSHVQPTVNGVLTSLGLVVAAAQTAFTLFWKPSGVSDTIEVKTSPLPTVPDTLPDPAGT